MAPNGTVARRLRGAAAQQAAHRHGPSAAAARARRAVREDLDEVLEVALDEARILEAAGLDGLIVENVGDTPFFRESVPAITVAAMAVIVREVRRATRLAVGVNLLRNACTEALSIASVCGADFIRCNVVIGAYVTDQGIIQGCAAELARLRRTLDSRRGRSSATSTSSTPHRSSTCPSRTPPRTSPSAAAWTRSSSRARAARPAVAWSASPRVTGAVELPVLIGSGIGLDNAAEYYAACDGAAHRRDRLQGRRRLGRPQPGLGLRRGRPALPRRTGARMSR